ncbi:DNA adenine methylase [Terasakiella sp. A23]|uniref:DNA adenine methylase n=1 Tax=Terasakiella sp. FCG-A23 TaxID=3080561 RepID=UPI00295358E0|nr:DNA adenine methylase [Terasakiella sp. A23]MDV7340959.1 DNA adenine methylase [Terasakiella sp. A23]
MTKNTNNPVLPLAPYLGGKRNLANRLIERIDQIKHITYAEPFVGMGGVFLRRPNPVKAEYINDINDDIYNLFRQVQQHESYFVDYMKYFISSRREFERLAKCPADVLTELQRAARFLYLQRTCFGGQPKHNSFGVSPGRSARFNLTTLQPMLKRLHHRMTNVSVECLPYQDFITRIDRPGTLFYLDPPYWGCETDYGKNVFYRDDFQKIADQLANIKGRFILSINDTPEVRSIFDQFDIEEVSLNYSISRNQSHKAKELIISN